MIAVTCYPEYHDGVFVIRVNGQIIDTVPNALRATALANRLAGALATTVNV